MGQPFNNRTMRSTSIPPEQAEQEPELQCWRRLALLVEYDGTEYSGFQWQATSPTVQAEVERAIACLTGESARVRGASRTDAGAHAAGQVVDFVTQAPYTTGTFVNALNSYLPRDIRVKAVRHVPLTFNSRRDASGRVYRYTVLNTRRPSALARNFSHWVPKTLDVDRMREAASYLRGSHDFSAVAAGLKDGDSGVRNVARWEIWREGESVLIEAEANAFLPHQVRRTNGILVGIGLGKMSTDVLKDMIDGTLRELVHCPSVPARGLCLMRVNYPKHPCEDQNDDEAA